ncbi:YdcF family protein [Streptomyces olindensis]|uniref:YdcF family protein n=1 Tax=Streptomyces olindensis TaxID=358823 RepID=UPI00340238E3
MVPFLFAIAAGLTFLVYLARVRRDPRRFGNAVLLGLALVLLTLALLARIATGSAPAPLVAAMTVTVLLLALGVFVLAFLLIANGGKMVRREGRRPGNLLSAACSRRAPASAPDRCSASGAAGRARRRPRSTGIGGTTRGGTWRWTGTGPPVVSGLAGLGILGCVALTLTAADTDSRLVWRIAGAILPVAAYVSYLFLSFLVYAFLYARMRVDQDVDFVVVLGSGLIGGSRMPPLLASRLDRARAVYERQAARGVPPLLITSGGQGPDEYLPEAHAMAAHLIAHGVPETHVVREDRSRTTEENLRFSKAIMQARRPDYRCVIVTNNFHVFRAALTARRTDVDGHVIGSPTAAYFWPSATIRELAAIFLHHRKANLTVCALLALLGVLLSS